MQTILGSNGQIGHELAKELYKNYTKEIRLVSRKPQKIHDSDELVSADLLDFNETNNAISGSDIVYFTVGLPMDSEMWMKQFSKILDNVIEACKIHRSKLVFFDNTYMYPKTSAIQFENTIFSPSGKKSLVRAQLADKIIKEMEANELKAVVCRAPEFYGPEKTQSITNTMIFSNIKAKQKLKIPISDSTLRTLIWTPDASRAMALIGNTDDAYGQTWHLPCDRSLTYKEMINIADKIENEKLSYSIIKLWKFKVGSLFNKNAKELLELLPRYEVDNLFNSDKFKKRFPSFPVTFFESGIKQILVK
ncbi:Saccharopine dehydrogenase related protein [Lactococcus cremoris subsp. cremoris SK11]|uniref:Saccharopine dehydrogenase related protein n=2 Tax=Lactococcus lactis subsp. cremoris TaxID=1359 RepID=Q02YZ7_LACLS|nr:NAD-dependent epimerase/dehydratase family protein [Lactococcus cremoris]ABJ72825.1 Saccharopine dehydrogenase related protein [Lactococcus cremoris subsp. cremoris SK11]ARE23421.1 NAD-dependent epimerase/dehydratase family protein [Lactococcus cremoris]KZK46784.1 Nucleoside-diphosphate-sugar epimerase [Lactococcus cremoris]KZK50937.1 Nucleoside-diphosphate-sugar epimerase [Lactococcus cremoris]MCT4408494.1 NAD-dependent epimerase/dehydratase family protein [Lactococcus cremoris]